jgi:hypothetical protein
LEVIQIESVEFIVDESEIKLKNAINLSGVHLVRDIIDDRASRTVDFHNTSIDGDGIFEREGVDDVGIGG